MNTKSIPLPPPPPPPVPIKVIGYLHCDTYDGKFRKANKHSVAFDEGGELRYVGNKRYMQPITEEFKREEIELPEKDIRCGCNEISAVGIIVLLIIFSLYFLFS